MEAEDIAEEAIEILTYWLGLEYWKKREKDPPNCTSYYDDMWRNRWFAKEELTKVVDDHIRDRFEPLVKKGLQGELNSWTKDPHGTLALIILLDQFTRNIYRYTEDAWCGDSIALDLCLDAIKKGQDVLLKPVARAVLYMPLMHAEDLYLSKKSMDLFSGLYEDARSEKSLTVQVLERFKKAAVRHYNVIQQFGRYPERNKYLGRASKEDEAAYLKG